MTAINPKKTIKSKLPDYVIEIPEDKRLRRLIYLPYKSRKAIIYGEILRALDWDLISGEARYEDLLCICYAEPRYRR